MLALEMLLIGFLIGVLVFGVIAKRWLPPR